ncbi:uncharacterized protein LOC126586808 isoform X4 [Malus sylvestris]|uniref:uncharacterized protein LOC126586808 isoform X4 n=1 Tax=Malus sylvestris TaxID=3752 RepID=UPI0021ACBE39|nr:uncharacterized protein LOC126586808 isoform X4 [Malus sylvestris]
MASTKPVDASLWWDSFSLLLTELENASLSSDLPPILVKTLKDNHAWFVDTVSCFKPPNENSREALNSQQVEIWSHQLNIKPELKDKALKISSYLDIDLFTLWAEETLIEDNLVLDILFPAYYESFCTCNGERWKTLCVLYKLAVSTEALRSSYQTKVQLLLILIETLDLESLLQMVHDAIPFRQGTFVFTLADVQEMEAIISTFNAFETKEAGPLILAWAVFLCLISSLPGSEESNVLMEIDHVGYVRQAFEAALLNDCVEILQSDVLKEPDGPADGYRSVLRTFVSAFIASYAISLQLEDKSLKLILDILCKIYQGEESLCIQFWDRESFIDGPIRCLLCNLEGEFPFRTVELVRLLSSLCEGTWPAECVYNFLDKSLGISSLVEINGSFGEDRSQIVETHLPLHVPGFEGLVIPSKTCGHILRLVSGNTALVRWEAVCFALMDIGNSSHFQSTGMNGQTESNMRLVEVICTLVRKLSPTSDGAALMSVGINILAKMLRCSPSRVSEVALKANIFGFRNGHNDPSSGTWFLSGKLAKMLLIDCEQNDSCCSLTISVLDFTLHLVETGLKNDAVLDLIVFSIQYVLVNHEYWKFKVKHTLWRVTLKVLEVMKKIITSVSYSEKLDEVILDRLLSDSSIHSKLPKHWRDFISAGSLI